MAGAMLLMNVSYAGKLSGYKETVDALSKGKKITLVVNFDKCQIINNHSGKLTGLSIIRLPEVVVVRNDTISARVVIPTGDVAEFPELGNVYQTSSCEFDKNNQLHGVLHVLDPVTYQDKIPPTDILCQIGTGFNVYS